MSKLMPNISLVIPCFNEEGNIDGLIKKSKKLLENKKNQLILVNNGSTDNTKNKINSNMKKYKNIQIVNIKNNIGFGNGLKKGLAKSKNFISGLASHSSIAITWVVINKQVLGVS